MNSAASRPPDAYDELVADLVEEFFRRVRSGEALDAEAFATDHPEYAEALREVLPAAAALAGFLDSGATPSISTIRDEVPAGGTLGDYRIEREVGRGGMGIVYEAEQVSLGRRVALKILPFGAARDPRQLARFRVEAHAVATLNHPNIVPIYAVGSEHGMHYYAMQYIEGRSLAEIVGLRRAEEEDGRRDPMLATTEVAQLGLQASGAIEHAHAMGILHRDIKPANMLVDGRGHLWIVDFGLARIQAESDLTRTGDMIGTLRYMSPEQALCRGVLDPRSDIYSLGVSLYELLVLRPAFDGRERQELLARIASEDPVSPRRLDRRIPQDLETIILKAMSKEAGGRYASAAELAEDFRRYLGGRPILARRPGPLERVGRWMRRHKKAVAATSAVLSFALVGLAVGNFMLWEEKTRTRDHLELALKAMDNLDHYLGEQGLDTNPEQTQAILATLRANLTLYTRLADQNPRNQEARWAAARAHRRMGDIQARSSGKLDEAEAAYREADAMLEQLSGQDPANVRYRDERAELLGHWGKLVYLNGGHRVFRGSLAAEGPLRRSLEIERALLAEFPAETRYPRRFVRNAFYLIGLLFVAGRDVERERWLAEARGILREIVPGCPTDYLDLAAVQKLLGDLMHATGCTEEGDRAYDCSITLLESAPRKPLASPGYRRSVVGLFAQFAQQSFCHSGQPDKQAGFFARALPVWDDLVAPFDLTPADQHTRSHAQSYVAYLLENRGRFREAVGPELRAVELDEALFRNHPSVYEYRRALGTHSESLGRLLMKTGRPREAMPHFDRAIEVFPDSTRLKERIVWYLAIHPNPFPARAVELADRLTKDHPDQPSYWSRLGQARVRSGDWSGAEEALGRVIRTAEGGDSDDWLFLAIARWHLGDKRTARHWYDKAAGVLAGSTAPRDPAIDELRGEVANLIGLSQRSSSVPTRSEP